MRIVPTPPREFLAWRDPELTPCFLGYELLSDVEMYWPNEVEKGSGGVGRWW